MEAARNLENKSGILDVDRDFLKLFEALAIDAINKAASCTGQVLEISNHFLSQNASEILKKFYILYFGNQEVDNRKEVMNRSVDDMFDQIQSNLAQGREADAGVVEDASLAQDRLGLSGLQKQLEGLITMDEGIRDRIVPALATMQFEDAVRQRLEHISYLWQQTFLKLESQEDFDLTEFGKEIGKCLTSVAETALFYEIVVKEAPPERGGMDQGEALLF